MYIYVCIYIHIYIYISITIIPYDASGTRNWDGLPEPARIDLCSARLAPNRLRSLDLTARTARIGLGRSRWPETAPDGRFWPIWEPKTVVLGVDFGSFWGVGACWPAKVRIFTKHCACARKSRFGGS